MAFKTFQKNGSAAPMNEINTTPLVDVMLVLLIIFIVTTPIITNTIKIDLPQNQSKATVETVDVVYVAIDKNGNLFLNDEAIEIEKIKIGIANAVKNNIEKTEVHLQIDKNTRYEKIAEIMFYVKEAGINKIGFVNKAQ